MDALKYLSALRLYGVDVLVIALGVTLLTSLLKKTVLKKLSKKVFVLLPYALGLIVYCVWRLIITKSVAPLTRDFLSTAEGGFAVGCAATLYYVIYEQFIRGKKESGANVLAPLLEGVIPAEAVEEFSASLLENSAGKTQEEIEALAKEMFSALPVAMGDAEKELYARLIAAYLFALRKE